MCVQLPGITSEQVPAATHANVSSTAPSLQASQSFASAASSSASSSAPIPRSTQSLLERPSPAHVSEPPPPALPPASSPPVSEPSVATLAPTASPPTSEPTLAVLAPAASSPVSEPGLATPETSAASPPVSEEGSLDGVPAQFSHMQLRDIHFPNVETQTPSVPPVTPQATPQHARSVAQNYNVIECSLYSEATLASVAGTSMLSDAEQEMPQRQSGPCVHYQGCIQGSQEGQARGGRPEGGV